MRAGVVGEVVGPGGRRARAAAAATRWNVPTRSLRMIGVTGTNGKTTTVARIAAHESTARGLS